MTRAEKRGKASNNRHKAVAKFSSRVGNGSGKADARDVKGDRSQEI
jgi:hypothetical protein